MVLPKCFGHTERRSSVLKSCVGRFRSLGGGVNVRVFSIDPVLRRVGGSRGDEQPWEFSTLLS